ncbi:MAG: antitoxin family protein [Spirochaetales bacterium]|nr:antitoxin family protein [Spirochaetales bacterium]
MYIRGTYENGVIRLSEPVNYPDGIELMVKIRTKEELVDIREWNISKNDYIDLTPVKARNVMIRCFMYAHLEEVLTSKRKRVTYNDYDLAKDGLLAEIKLTFKQVDEDIQHPTKSALKKVLNLLTQKQINRGATPEIIKNHQRQLTQLIDALP